MSDTPILPPADSIAATLLIEKALAKRGMPARLCMREARAGYAAACEYLGIEDNAIVALRETQQALRVK